MDRPLMDDAFRHHVWATLRSLDACGDLTPEQLATSVPGTFGSILDTARHLVASDLGYLNTLTNLRVARIREESMDLAALRAAMEPTAGFWAGLLRTDLAPDTIATRRRDDGSERAAPVGILLAQALHHGTDHRSQICTALTALGIDPPEVDVWDFAAVHGQLSETPPTA